eukprot:6480601-Amphidinium_carterae.1
MQFYIREKHSTAQVRHFQVYDSSELPVLFSKWSLPHRELPILAGNTECLLLRQQRGAVDGLFFLWLELY